MPNEPKCLQCGAPLTSDARDGVCPKCLLALALAAPAYMSPEQVELTSVDVDIRTRGAMVRRAPAPRSIGEREAK